MRCSALLFVLLVTVGLVGCGPTRPGEGGTAISPVALADVLPVPTGLASGGPAIAADVDAVQRELAGRADPEGVRRLEAADLQEGAIRRWSGDDGAMVTVVTTRWTSRILATNVGAASAELLLNERGARAWTPASVPGSRGAWIGEPTPTITLSRNVGPNGIFIRAVGPVERDAIARMMELAVKAAEGGLGED